MRTMTATIDSMTRLTNTTNGGPRYRLTIDYGHQFDTAPDTADSFGWVPDRLTHRPVALTVDGRGRVIGIDTI